MSSKDEALLRAALRKLRERFPDGVHAVFQTSDQDFYGFVLDDVLDSAGCSLIKSADPDEVHDELADLDWDSVMHEDAQGRAVIPLSA